jgi:hypothetical protein
MSEWIGTKEAADRLGYTTQHFRRKFDGIIPARRFPGGYRKWLRSAVEAIAPAQVKQKAA